MITISYADGRKSTHETVEAAQAEIETQYPDAVYCEHGWESSSPDRERLLAWANEDDADCDGGQNAVAEIIRDAAGGREI